MIAEREKSLDEIVKKNAQGKEAVESLKKFEEKFIEIMDSGEGAPGFGAINRDLTRLSFMAGSGDAAPSSPILASIDESCTALSGALLKWHDLSSQSLPPLNGVLAKYALGPLPAPAVPSSVSAPCSP